jgi:hypothetical protein
VQTSVELLVTRVEVQSSSGHTNHSSTLGNMVERSDESSCET